MKDILNIPKLKQVLVAAGVLFSLILAVGVYRLNNTAHIYSGQEDIESASDSRLAPKDGPLTNSESVASAVYAQGQEYSAMVRSEIHRSPTLPVGVAFKNTLGLLDDLNKENPAYALYYLQHEMGFDEIDDAESSRALLNRMLDFLQTINSEIKQENRRLGCSLGVPNAAGEQIYSILEAMDDTPEIVAKKHLDQLYKEFGKDTATKLQQWMNNQKTKMTQVKYNYKEYYEATGKSPDARLASICYEPMETIQQSITVSKN